MQRQTHTPNLDRRAIEAGIDPTAYGERELLSALFQRRSDNAHQARLADPSFMGYREMKF